MKRDKTENICAECGKPLTKEEAKKSNVHRECLWDALADSEIWEI